MARQPALVFLDANVFVAASRSQSGGSATVMAACVGRRFRAATTLFVVMEARRNIASKFGDAELVRFYRQLAALDPVMVPRPSPNIIAECAPITGDKDAHVLAAARLSGAQYLITLDRQHLLTPSVSSAGLPLTVMTPGDFLQQIIRESGR